MARWVGVFAGLWSLWCGPVWAVEVRASGHGAERAAARVTGARRMAERSPATVVRSRTRDTRWPEGSAMLVPLLGPLLFPFLVPHEVVARSGAAERPRDEAARRPQLDAGAR